MKDLPKTYRDAAVLTRKLKIRYLWIDSLCIIQDDANDWERELANMCSVCRNAHVTIAATAATDCTTGFLYPRNPSQSIRVLPPEETLRDSGLIASDLDQVLTMYARIYPYFSKCLMRSPLFQRAWTLQEMILSRKVIHFAAGQLFWHCPSRFTSEDGTIDDIASIGSSYLTEHSNPH
jgi:hypothetical protein